jgi:hypothetical protein
LSVIYTLEKNIDAIVKIINASLKLTSQLLEL